MLLMVRVGSTYMPDLHSEQAKLYHNLLIPNDWDK